MPQITSCCPAWVNYCEKMAPDILPNLSSCKSPQQMFGAVMKRYFAKQLRVRPELLCFISIMPCNAKKYDASRPEFRSGDVPDVDIVMTTTDVIAMFEERHIDPLSIKPLPVDAFFGKVTAAGIIFGATRVAEGALRWHREDHGRRMESFNYKACGGCRIKRQVRLGETDVRLAVVSGLQTPTLIDRIRAGDAPTTHRGHACPAMHQRSGKSGSPVEKRHGIPLEVRTS